MHLNARYLKDRMWGVGGREGGSRGRACTCAVCCAQLLSPVRLFATLWTAARQAPVSMGFSRREHWSGLPCPPPGDLPNPGIEPRSPALQVDSLPTELPGKPRYRYQFSSVAQSCLTLCDPMNTGRHTRPPCPSPTPGVHPNPYPLSQ